jgi:hypothetical protein
MDNQLILVGASKCGAISGGLAWHILFNYGIDILRNSLQRGTWIDAERDDPGR